MNEKRHKKLKAKPKYSIINNLWFLIKDFARIYPLYIVYFILSVVCSIVSVYLIIYLPKISIDLIEAKCTNISPLIWLVVIIAICLALKRMSNLGGNMMAFRMSSYYMRKIYYLSLHCDYMQIESGKGQTKYRQAMMTLDQGDWSRISKMAIAVEGFLISIGSFLLYIGVISKLHFAVVFLLVGLSLINYIAVNSAQQFEFLHKEEEAKVVKKLKYIEDTSKDVKAGKDIRIFDMTNWFLEIREALLLSFEIVHNKIKSRYFMAGVVNAITLFFRDGITYGYLIGAILAGSISVSEFVLYFGAITGVSSFVGDIIKHANSLNHSNLSMNDMRNFLDNEVVAESENLTMGKELVVSKIEFRNVCFSYEEENTYVLKDFSMVINKGEKIALVGINGAGKTTIVKLLCGFYQPNSGEILINDIDIKNIKREDLFCLFSVVFQDILMLPFKVLENISMKIEAETDITLVEECLRKVGLLQEIEKNRKGIHEMMTKSFEDGLVLSGGQQQKLLMARALYKESAILILDEPTAALDPIAESETYEKFHEIAKDKMTIYISHRLASTRFCDRIIFLSNGIVGEEGTHEELMNLGLEYAHMFEVQSHYYQEEVQACEN